MTQKCIISINKSKKMITTEFDFLAKSLFFIYLWFLNSIWQKDINFPRQFLSRRQFTGTHVYRDRSLIWSFGKINMLLEEICCRKRCVAGRDMLPEEICCQRRYAAGRNKLPEEICCRRRYVAGGDAMLKKVSSQKRYLAQRRYLANGGI